MITDDELRRIMPNLKADRRALMLPFIQQAMDEFEINNYWREAAFIAQLAHESAELRYMEEIASGAAYEGRRDLGNTQPGDGKRFKGRGPIQLTGRANYKRYGDLLGLDLINNPTQAATPQVGFRIAGLFWKSNGLNELADRQQFVTITKRINGGTNGLADRQKYYERAKQVLSRGDQPATVAPPPPAPSADTGAPPPDASANPFAGLSGGAEGGTRGLGSTGGGGGGDASRGIPLATREIPPNLSRGILPGKESARAAKKRGAKKAATKKAATKKSATKKSAAKRATTARPAGAAKRSGAKKSAAKRSADKMKSASRKASSGKGAAKRGGGAKKGAAKRSSGGAKKGAAARGGASKGASKKGGANRGAAKKGGSKKGGAKKGASKRRR
ncbi:MAG TPA: glycoside hydrolase family 19 protein [Pyrinomonadaceae bacterium]|jgi:predicted chitinase|nr:glycoside hydrolase family 19 protein [Pyrinomonadaceae bacterium]